jgi:isoquinoline 1-oxidoreductase
MTGLDQPGQRRSVVAMARGEIIIGYDRQSAELGPDRSLLSVLREDLHLTGAKPACGEGECGACTVLADGVPVRACQIPALAAAGKAITTIEGLAESGVLDPVQRAFLEEGAVQCGYCIPGMVLATVALLSSNPEPDASEIRAALAGNVCRCGGYTRIERAVVRAATLLRDHEWSPPATTAAQLPQSVGFWEFRPATPWDLAPFDCREYFDLLGDGLVVVFEPDPRPAPADPRRPASSFAPRSGGAWLHVGVDGTVTAFTGKVDLGQDNRTALSLLVAEELGIEPGAVRLAMGDTDLCPFDIGTFGSRSLPGAGEDLRMCAAGAQALIAAHGPPRQGWRRVELVPAGTQPSAPARWRSAGRATARVTALALVTGAHRFPSDLVHPGMLHGQVLRAPAYGAKLVSVDFASAQAIDGVTLVHEAGIVAAAAADAATAARALAAVEAEWTAPPQPSEADLALHLRAHPIDAVGWEVAQCDEQGDVDLALAVADVRLEATYTTAYIAHASLEPRVALAEWVDGRLTVWTGTQQPYTVRHELALALAIPEPAVRVLVPDFGGGFGSKHTEEIAIAAAALARAADRPVRVALTREEEFRFSYLRPAAVIDVRSGARRDGTITAWQFSNINSGAAGLPSPYACESRRVSFQPADSPLPQGPYRSLAATANHFARESQIDELAVALGLDPLELRLRNLTDERLAAVVRAAAAHAGWDRHRRDDGAGVGIACGMEKGGRVATCAQVRLSGRALRVERIVTAYECGAIVNPDNVARQIEGATVMGLGGALFEAIHFDSGRILNASLGAYRVPRFTDVPEIETILLDRPDLPSAGAGETPIVALAPAIANAIVAAGGPRLRSLPLIPNGDVPPLQG